MEAFKVVARSNMKLVYPYMVLFLITMECCLAMILAYGIIGALPLGSPGRIFKARDA